MKATLHKLDDERRLTRRRRRAGAGRGAQAPRLECSCELLILPGGGIIAHNLTPAVAELLKETLGV